MTTSEGRIPAGTSSGPLHGVRVVELAGIGPGPFCGMLLADMGAEVVRVERPSTEPPDEEVARLDLLQRGRRSVVIDLKRPEGVDLALDLVERADALVEGFRPQVMERLGLGPDVCLARNPALVYGRMTGWGQEGELAQTAGHDIDFIALVGALDAIGRPGERPVPPLNLVGDFGGGGMLLAYGVACALVEARRSGRGQVVDAAMVDGVALLLTMQLSLGAMGVLRGRGENVLDGGAPWYDTYLTRDGRYVAVGAVEDRFYGILLAELGLDPDELPPRFDRRSWPVLRARLQERFLTRSRDEWAQAFATTDACVAPVLSLDEAPHHPHLARRGTFVEVGGVRQPAPAPRFSATPGAIAGGPPARPGLHTDAVLADWLGLDPAALDRLRGDGVVS